MPEQDDWRQQQEADERERWEFCQSVLARYESVMYAAVKTGILPADNKLVVTEAERDQFRAAMGLKAVKEFEPTQPADFSASGKPF